MKKIFLSILVLFCLSGLGLFAISRAQNNQIALTPSPTPSLTFSFQATESDKTALEITKQHTTVELKQYDFGAMVTALNNVPATNSYFWSLSINGTLAETGADKIIVQKGDTVSWKYEAIKQ